MSRSPTESRSVATALTAGGRLLVDRTADVLPAYLLAVGLTAAARVPVVVALGVALASLASTGRLEPLVRALVDLQTAAREANGGGLGSAGGDEPIPPGVGDALANAVTPTVVAAFVLGGVGALLVGLVVRGVVSAVAYGTLWAALNDEGERGGALAAGVGNAGRWRTYLGILLVRVLIAVVAIGVPAGVAGLAATSLAGGSETLGAVGLVVAVGVAGLGAIVVVVAFFLLSFAEAAATVDRVGAGGAVRGSLGFVRTHPAEALAFALVAVGGYLAVAVAIGVANAAGFGSLGGLLPLVVSPVLDAGAVALYAGVGRPTADDRPRARTAFKRTLAGGLRAFGGFLRDHPLAVVAAHAVLVGGIALGYQTTAAYGVTAPPLSDVGTVFGAIPVGPFVTIAVNNWLVGVGLAFGGLAFGAPAVTGLLFNGVLIGGLAGVFDRTAFLALVAPHGVLELPVIAVTGAVGFHLGVVGWRAIRGRTDAGTVAVELRRATMVLVGAGVLLVVAAAIEAFLTPFVAAQVLGG